MRLSRVSCAAAFLVTGILVAGCTYSGEPATPIERNLSWFSYLNGDDIGYRCIDDGIDRYRMVYNAVYVEQVRAYDLVVVDGGTTSLRTRVIEPVDLSKFTVESPLDLFSPWRAKVFDRTLSAAETELIQDALWSNGFESRLEGKIQLHSDNFYWVISACERGRFRFNAFGYPSERFAALTFPEVLYGLDPSGIAVNEPRKTDPRKIHGASYGEELRSANRFNLAADANGLVSIGRLF